MEKRERIKINKIRNENGDITPDTTEIQKKKKRKKGHYEQLYVNKLNNP